jgi:hypothetical protein
VILWGLAVLAAAAALLPAWQLLVVNVNVKAATGVLRRLLEAGNLARAIKVTRAAPRSVYLRAVRRALDGPGDAGRGEAEVRDALQGRFDRELTAGLRPLRRVAQTGYLAIGAGGLAAGLAATASPPLWPPAIAGAVALLLALRNLGQLDALERRSRAGFAELLEPAIAAIQGSPVTPPAPPDRAEPAEPAPEAAPPPPGAKPSPSPGGLALVATIAGREVARVTLDESVVKIGRMPSSQLHLDDPSVSRMHAVIEVSDGEVQIIDLGSERGTVHNGKRINKAAIAAGDVLDLGDVRVEVVAADAAAGRSA